MTSNPELDANVATEIGNEPNEARSSSQTSESEISESETEQVKAADDKLSLRNVKNSSEIFVLDKNISKTFSLGRSKSMVHYSIDSEVVADVHAHLTLAGPSWVVYKDPRLKSSYVLKVNGQEFRASKVLEIGDDIYFGKTGQGVSYRLEAYSGGDGASANQEIMELDGVKYHLSNHGQVNGSVVCHSGQITVFVNDRKH